MGERAKKSKQRAAKLAAKQQARVTAKRLIKMTKSNMKAGKGPKYMDGTTRGKLAQKVKMASKKLKTRVKNMARAKKKLKKKEVDLRALRKRMINANKRLLAQKLHKQIQLEKASIARRAKAA